MEKWRDIPEYESIYEISNYGKVRRKDSNYILKNQIKPNGYFYVTLSKNKVTKKKYIHRLVAEAFLPNPKNLAQVNHKDGCKANNHINNLEWCTQQENLLHAKKHGLISPTIENLNHKLKPVIRVEDGKKFDSATMAAKEMKVSVSAIRKAILKGKNATSCGFHWKYE